MKKLHLLLFTSLMIVSNIFLFAGDGKKTNTILDGILMIPKTTEAPEIDGAMDDVWSSVTATQMLLSEGSQALDTAVVYDDHYAAFRAMWDDDNFYIFMSVVDDSLLGGAEANVGSPWLNDCIEIFFDGGNEKATSYDANDVQWRWVYGEEVGNSPATTGGTNSPGVWAWMQTSSGYNFELQISADSLASRFTLEADAEIGFEISNGDLETASSPQTVLHWWTNQGTTWNNPSLFGTALLVEKEVESILKINYAEDTPVIDGEMTEGEGWELADELSMTRFEGAPDGYPQDSTFHSWKDHIASFWTLWDEDYLYLFVRSVDDSLFGGAQANVGSPWLNDCVELFVDGGNEKASSYDANDVQWRWVYGEEVGNSPATTGGTNSPGEWAWQDTEQGYDFELRISADSLASRFTLENDTEIGFEVSNGDLETASSPQLVLHWWTNVATTWNDPSLFGTALLVGGLSVGVNDDPNLISGFSLQQNYPNPFNPSTKITFTIAQSEKVKLTVYNIFGEQVAVLIDDNRSAGTYSVDFYAENLASGVYFYKLQAGNNSLTKKMMFLK